MQNKPHFFQYFLQRFQQSFFCLILLFVLIVTGLHSASAATASVYYTNVEDTLTDSTDTDPLPFMRIGGANETLTNMRQALSKTVMGRTLLLLFLWAPTLLLPLAAVCTYYLQHSLAIVISHIITIHYIHQQDGEKPASFCAISI